MENDISPEFLAVLREYTTKSRIHRSFQAWRKYVMFNRRRYDTACIALEHWNHYTIKKCFDYLKAQSALKNIKTIPYSKGIYLIILAALCFLPTKSIKSYGCRVDKLLSLFKQNSILRPNLAMLQSFVKSWETYLTQKYFGLLKKRCLAIKDYKIWRQKKTKKRCFNFLKRLVKNKKGVLKLKRITKLHYFKQLAESAKFQQALGLKNGMALKYWKKASLQRCFQILSDYTIWNRQNTDKSVLAKKFYELNLMMKSLSRLKLFIKSGALQKNKKVKYQKFRTQRLLSKTFHGWKKYNLTKIYLQIKFEEYTKKKGLACKNTNFNNWRWIFISKAKITYYIKLKLLEKGFKGLKELALKTQKVKTISRMSLSHSGKKKKLKKNKDINDYLLDEKNDVLDRILFIQTKNQSNLLQNCFKRWGIVSHGTHERRMLKYQAKESYENKILKKSFQALKQIYIDNLSERVKMFRATQFNEESLMKKVFLVLDTEKGVSKLLSAKLLERYHQKIAQGCFDAILGFSKKEGQIKKIIRRFRQAKEDILVRKGFYFLKKRTDFNVIKRRSNKLAQIINQKRLYTKAFLSFKHMLKINKKAQLITKRKEKKVLKNMYLTWRFKFKEEKKIKKVVNYQGSNKVANIFERWKVYAQRKRVTNSIIKEFAERRRAIYLQFIWEIWKKIMSLSRQKRSVGQALFISYVYRFKKQVLHGWNGAVRKLQLQRQIQLHLSEQKQEELRRKYFEVWLRKSEKFRSQIRAGLDYILYKRSLLAERVLKSWAAVAKERVIKAKLLRLSQEKLQYKLVAKSFRAWQIYVAGRNTREQIVDIKSRFSEFRMQKKVFIAMQLWIQKRRREREITQQIANIEKTRILEQYFYTWCEEFKDMAFDRAGAELIDKYRKVMCFRLFQRKIEERKELRVYCDKLDQFALEIYKRKSFLTFRQNSTRLAAQRKLIDQSMGKVVTLRRKKAFGELKQILAPRIEKMRVNMKAMKFYILKLYSLSFNQWKLFMAQQGRLRKASEQLKPRVSFDWKTKFDDNLSDLKQSKRKSTERVDEHEDNKDPKLKAKVMGGLKDKVDLKNKLRLISKQWIEEKQKSEKKKYFKAWLDTYVSNDKRRYTLVNVLVRTYKTCLEKAFARLTIHYLKKKKLELCFDELHEKYIMNLLKKNFDSWKMQFVFQRLTHDSVDEETW